MINKSPERKFLHDLASPLATAIFITDALLEDHKAKNPVSDETSQIEILMSVLLEAKKLIEGRRNDLVAEAKNQG